jgi:perosamine synthetase
LHPVHIGGLISPGFLEVAEFCRKNALFLIEDAAHAHGSRMAGKHAGTFGDGGAFSFFPTKVITTMEGGMITTNDKEVAQLAKSYRNQGKKADQKFGCDHYVLGNSWRMLEISAAMGLVLLRKLDDMVFQRNRVVRAIKAALRDIGISYCDSSHMESASNYKLIVRYDEDVPVEEMKRRFQKEGVILGGGVYEKPCHLQPVFSDVPIPPQGLPVAEAVCPKHICPPVTSGMTESDVQRVTLALRKCLRPQN